MEVETKLESNSRASPVDSSAVSGYLADTEGQSSWERHKIVRRKSFRTSRKDCSSHRGKRIKFRKRRILTAMGLRDCSWIQRIYSSTPSKLAAVTEITGIDDLCVLRGWSRWRRAAQEPNHILPLRIPALLQPNCTSHLMRTKSTKNQDGSTNDFEFSALMDTVSALVREYHDQITIYEKYTPHVPA